MLDFLGKAAWHERMLSLMACGLLQAPPSRIQMHQLRPIIHRRVNMQSKAVTPDELTLEAVAARFPSMSELMEIPEGAERLQVMETHLKARLLDLPLARVRVAPSTIDGAGMGLFATRDIRTGELVTLYPCDALVTVVRSPLQEDDDEATVSEIYFDVNAPAGSDWHANFKAQCPEFIRHAWSYSVSISPLRSIIGDPTRATDDAAYLAHMVNDFAMCAGSDKNAIEAYVAASEGAANVGLDTATTNGCHVAMVATKPIREGDEILLSYGAGYWLGPGQL